MGTVLPQEHALKAVMPEPGVMVDPGRSWSPCVLQELKQFPDVSF
jgi:hypothetical protein